jgi:hypothetical protein
MAASMAVTQVPILAPKASAIPAFRVMKPWEAMTITIPVVADEDWINPVNTAATRMPMNGFSMLVIRSRNGW